MSTKRKKPNANLKLKCRPRERRCLYHSGRRPFPRRFPRVPIPFSGVDRPPVLSRKGTLLNCDVHIYFIEHRVMWQVNKHLLIKGKKNADMRPSHISHQTKPKQFLVPVLLSKQNRRVAQLQVRGTRRGMLLF